MGRAESAGCLRQPADAFMTKAKLSLNSLRSDAAESGLEHRISHIHIENGFMYLYAIIDVYSRYIVGWGLYNTLDASNAIEVLDRAVTRFGAQEIINSDQGVQHTCDEWHRACDKYEIRISMDGRARCLDNVWIERF